MDSTHDPLAMAKSRKRPRSRGSTASIRSATTQPNLEQAFSETPELYQAQWLPNPHGQPRELLPTPMQMTPEDLLLASQLQASREFAMDAPSVNNTISGPTAHHSHSMSRHSVSADSFGGNTSFADDSQMMEREVGDDGDSFHGLPVLSKGSRTSANNETEMRQLFVANKHRNLQDVAEELHGNERGPNSERTRQIFAMLWINKVCTKGKGSVPRGRVYANYASRCATERITVLNPASFGKLVRVLFPGLRTRRLGVRGESKYHYVNFMLLEEQPELRETPMPPHVPLGESVNFSQSFNTIPDPSASMRSERAVFPSTEMSQQQQQQQQQQQHQSGNPAPRYREPTYSLYNQPLISNIDQLQSTQSKTMRPMCLVAETDEVLQQSEPLIFPAIEPFLPSGTDPDAAKSLTALYRSHCTSLVECIRYCKEKTFFHLFTSFQGTLTMPVQKLFANPAMAPWIEECDFILYQRMMRIVSSLTLQVVPKPVLDTLRSISARLVPHIRESFHGQPQHVVRAKEAPAAIFANLIDRALRVNLTAHAAANMLSNPANRDQMYMEWLSTINVRKVAEYVPTRGMDDVVNLLLSEMRDLLDPVNIPWEIECMSLQGDMVMRGDRQRPESTGDSSASNVLERWVNFLRSLSSHFPYASHADIVWCVQRVGTAIMRDLTIAQGKSFGSWWVTKCWVDEMVQFMAEQGGFMKQKSSQQGTVVAPKHEAAASRNLSNHHQGLRYSTGSDDFNVSSHMAQQPEGDHAQFPPGSTGGNGHQASHDDSGIGIRTPDEDLPMEKFGFTPANGQDLFAGTDLQEHIANI